MNANRAGIFKLHPAILPYVGAALAAARQIVVLPTGVGSSWPKLETLCAELWDTSVSSKPCQCF